MPTHLDAFLDAAFGTAHVTALLAAFPLLGDPSWDPAVRARVAFFHQTYQLFALLVGFYAPLRAFHDRVLHPRPEDTVASLQGLYETQTELAPYRDSAMFTRTLRHAIHAHLAEAMGLFAGLGPGAAFLYHPPGTRVDDNLFQRAIYPDDVFLYAFEWTPLSPMTSRGAATSGLGFYFEGLKTMIREIRMNLNEQPVGAFDFPDI